MAKASMMKSFFLKQAKIAVFLNGQAPRQLSSLNSYQYILVCDGALSYLLNLGVSLSEIDFILGDFDSIGSAFFAKEENCENSLDRNGIETVSIPIDTVDRKLDNRPCYVYLPDQNATDFEKCLIWLLAQEWNPIKHGVHVYGASGEQQDHYLGNLHVALKFKNQLELEFIDAQSHYFFAPRELVLNNIENCLVSLMPFPYVNNIFTHGLQWELRGEALALGQRIGIRNKAQKNTVNITHDFGDLIVFVYSLQA